MADTTTTNLGLTKPEVGASADTWGGKLNTNLDTIDGIFAGAGSGTSVGLNVGTGKTLTVGGTQNMSALTASTALALDASKNVVSVTNTGTGNNVLSASPTFTGTISGAAASLSGNLTFSSTAQRITGDFSNATLSNRLAFQTSTTNGNTTVSAIPNGTATVSGFRAFGGSDVANTSFLTLLQVGSSDSRILSELSGTGSYTPMTFYTSGAERMRLDTSGNLLLGTATGLAGSRLTVVGGGTQLSGGTTAQEGVRIQRATGYATFTGINNDNNAYNGLQFFTSASAAVTIDTSNNVGIGTTSPASKFNVGGGRSNFGANSEVYSIAVGYTQARCNAGQTYYIGATDSATPDLVFSNAAGTERMRLDTSGNLGIGTGSPAGKLDVSSSSNNIVISRSTGGYAAFQRVAPTGQQVYDFYTVNNVEVARITADGSNILTFSTGSSAAERMRIDSSGNVGIGGTAQAYSRLNLLGTYPTSSNATQVVRLDGTIPSGTTASYRSFLSRPVTQATAFTLTNLIHFEADPQTLGAGSVVTNQYGFSVADSLTGATNNYGFYSNIASGSNRWNFYAAGTARNYFAGSVSVGTTTDPGEGSIIVPLAKAFYTYTTNYGIGTPNSSGLQIFTADSDFIAFQHKNGVTVTERMRVSATGEVLVGGNTDNGAYNLQCNGTGVWGAGAYVNGSDARLKDNIQSLDSGLDVVKAMRPVTFQYKPDYSKDQSVQPGFIAQELQTAMAGKAYLEGVVQEGPNHLNVAYQSIIPILVKAIQELEAKVASLEGK